MKLFLRISASILSGLVLVCCALFAIPATRNFILNTFAPYSQVCKDQQSTIDDLNEANINNLTLLSETRTSLMNAEFKSISYQNEISVLQTNLTTSQNNLALVLSQRSELQNTLNEANSNLAYMSNQLSQLRNNYRSLNVELMTLMDAQNQDTDRINELNYQMNDLTVEMSRIECIVTSLGVASNSYEAQIAEYENIIAEGTRTIQDYENEIISLNSQIAELQETIRSLENVNQALNGDDSYKEIFQQIVGGTVTELTAHDLDGITEIRSYAFYNCHTLRSVELPESVQTIGQYAFYNCSNLSDFTITANLKNIGDYAFANCSNLNSMDLRNVDYVGGWAFYHSGIQEIYLANTLNNWGNCILQEASVHDVYVEEGATKIPFGLLHGCGQIQNVYLPSTLKTIETFGISNYSNNVNVFFAGTTEQFNQISYVASDNRAFATANVVCNYNY